MIILAGDKILTGPEKARVVEELETENAEYKKRIEDLEEMVATLFVQVNGGGA